MKYRLVASVGAEASTSRGGSGGKGGGNNNGSSIQILQQQGVDDQILTVLGGKASCRRKFVIHVHLVDDEENVVMNMNEELSVVATVAYAHDRSPIVQDDNLFLAEPPLLTTFNGVEYPSHDRPTRLVAGKASFKLAISLLSSKYDNRLFCICFTPFFTNPAAASSAVPALHLCDPCFSKPIRSISRKRSSTSVPNSTAHQQHQQQQSHIHNHSAHAQSHSHSHSHSHNHSHNISHSHTHNLQNIMSGTAPAHSYYPQQQQQHFLQRPHVVNKEDDHSSASVPNFDYTTGVECLPDLSEPPLPQNNYMYHDQHQHHHHQQQHHHHQQQQHMQHQHHNPIIETIDETCEPLFNVEQIVGGGAFVGGGMSEAEADRLMMMSSKMEQMLQMQAARFSPDPLVSRSESTSPISGILTSTDGSVQEDADVFSQSSARAGADRPISAPQTGDQVSSPFRPYHASSRVDSNACNSKSPTPYSNNGRSSLIVEPTMSSCKSSSKSVEVAVLQRFFNEATSTSTSTAYPLPALSPESNIEDEEQSLLSLELALQDAIRELEKKKEELRNKRRRLVELDDDAYDMHNNISIYPSSNWGVEGLSTSFNF